MYLINWLKKTPCPSAPVICTLVAFPVDEFAEIAFPGPKLCLPGQ